MQDSVGKGAARLAGAAALGLSALAGVYFWPDRGALRSFEREWTFGWLGCVLVAWAALLLRHSGVLARWLAEAWPKERSRRFALALSFAFCLAYAALHARPGLRMFSDDYHQLQAAQALYLFQRAGRCEEGGYFGGELACETFASEPRPKAYPMLLAAAYGVFGESESAPYLLNFALFALTGLLLVRLGHEIGAFAGAVTAPLVWGLTPVVAWWARSAGWEMAYSFLVTASLALARFSATRPARGASDASLAVLLALTFGLACQTRWETALLLPVVALPVLGRFVRDWRAGALSVAAGALSVVPLAAVFGAYRLDAVGAPPGQAPVALANLIANFPRNLDVVLDVRGGWPTVRAFGAMAVIGFGLAVADFVRRRRRELAAVVALWFLVPIAAISVTYWGQFQLTAHQRYAVVAAAPLALLAARASRWAADLIRARWPRRWRSPPWELAPALIAAVAIAEGAGIEGDRGIRFLHLRAEDRLIEEELARLPRGAIFYLARTGAVLTRGRAAFAYERLVPFREDWWKWAERRSGGEQYYLRGLDCWPGKKLTFETLDATALCDRIEREYELREVARHAVGDDYDFRVFRVLRRR